MTDSTSQRWADSGEAADRDRFARELIDQLSALETVAPDHLADLFLVADGATTPMRCALRNALHKALLRRTLAHARAHTRYYRDEPAYAEWIDTAPAEPPDLSCWPVLARDRVVADGAAFVADDVQLRSIAHTSGTTGPPLQVHKSLEEVDFLGAYYTRRIVARQRPGAPHPLTLSFPTPYHGVPVPLPIQGQVFASGVTDDTLIEDAVRVLRRTYSIPGHDQRISLLIGLSFQVVFFTSYLLEQGIDPRSFGLRCISITGTYSARHWRAFLAEAWGATINDSLTLTESAAGATRIGDGDLFKLDPHVVGEVVDVDSHAPLSDGVGALVLTDLHPFVQMQPLIRYPTGDLVRRVGTGPTGLVLFEYLGRTKNCVSWRPPGGGREWLIFSAKLHEVLTEIPDVRVFEWFSNVRRAKDRTIGSLPLYTLAHEERGGRSSIRLTVELRYAPHLYAQRAREIESRIVTALRDQRGAALARRLDAGDVTLDLRLVPPETLGDPLAIKI